MSNQNNNFKILAYAFGNAIGNSIVGKLQQAENDKLVAKQKAEQARLIRTVAYIFTVINSWRSDSALIILIFL